MLSSTSSFMLSIKGWTVVADEPGGEGGPGVRWAACGEAEGKWQEWGPES